MAELKEDPKKEATPATAAKGKAEEKALTSADLEKAFKVYSIAEFFKRNRQMLGYTGKIRSMTTIVHEAVTNSLDACEDAKILPEIIVEIQELPDGHFKIAVEDNGTGVPKTKVGQAFGKLLAGTKFSQRMQKRGQQGIGVCMRSDTLVPLVDGRVLPIKQIVDENMVGERVFALDVDSLKIIPARIKKCMKLKHSFFIEVNTSNGRKIFLTPENPVLTLKEGKPVWVTADSLKPGQQIAAPTALPKMLGESQKSVLELLSDRALQVDEPELLKQIRVLLKQKIGGFDKVAKATGIKKDILRNWFTQKMPGGNPHGRPTVEKLLLLARRAGVSEKAVLDNIHRVGKCGMFVKIPDRITPDVCWLAGIIAGNGHISSEKDDHGIAAIILANKDKRLIDAFCEKMHETFGVNYKVLYNEKKDYYTAVTSSVVAAKIFGLLGVPRGRKFDSFELSSILLSLDDRELAAYLRGLFDAEGIITSRNKAVTLMIANKQALEKVFYALLRFGIFASVNKAGKHNLVMVCGRKNLELFVNSIGFSDAGKNQLIRQIIEEIKASNPPSKTISNASSVVNEFIEKNKLEMNALPIAVREALKHDSFTANALQQLVAANNGNTSVLQSLLSLFTGDVNWLTVTDVRRAPNDEEFVYDLEVEGAHNFVAGGLVVHNSYATLFSQITTGKPAHVKSSTGEGNIVECDVSIDVKKNEPVIANVNEYRGKFRGIRFEAEFAEIDYNRSEYSAYEYLRRTALANPHAQITLIEPNKEIIVFPRASKDIPKRAKQVLPHPLGITTSDLIDMASVTQARKLSSFFTTEFARFSRDKVNEIKALCPGIDFEKDPKNFQWQEAEACVKAFQKVKWIAPDTSTLVPIGAGQITKSLKNLLQPEQLKVVERRPKVFRGGIPFSVEAAIAYAGKAGAQNGGAKGEIMRFANRVPLLFDAGNCAITEAVKSIDWGRYDLKNWEEMPVSIFINFNSVYVPYTGAGKLAISAEDEIVEEIRFALMECARDIAQYIHGLQRLASQEERRQIFIKYIKEVAEAIHDITGKEKAILIKKLEEIANEETALLEAGEKVEEEEEAEKILKKLEESEEKGFKEEGESKD